MSIFSIREVFFTILHYPVSYVEFAGCLAGVLAVWLATRSNILTWPVGLVNIVLFFMIFWQVELYSDVFLQVYYFAISIYGWHNWDREHKAQIPIRAMAPRQRIIAVALIALLGAASGMLMSGIHLLLPDIFAKPASFPYADSFVAVASVAANTLMAKRYIENWLLWIAVNILGIVIYFYKDIIFVSLQYLVFLILAIAGHIGWLAQYRLHHPPVVSTEPQGHA